MVGTPESQSRGLKWGSPDRQMAQLLRARTVPISLHPCYSPPLGSAHLWTGLEGNECGPPGLTGGPCYSVHFVLSQRSVRAHLAKQKPPTLIQGSTVLKVSVGFLFFLLLLCQTLLVFPWAVAMATVKYATTCGLASDVKEKKRKKRQINRLQTD